MANFVPNYMQQVNSQNWAEGLGSVVQALNNPQAFANAELLRAKKAEIESSIAYQQGKLGLETQSTGAQVNAYNASADKDRQQGALYAADIKLRNQQYDARNHLDTDYMNAGVASPLAHVLGGQARSSGLNTGTEDLTKSYVQLVRPDPVTIAPGATVQYAVGPNGERLDPRDTRQLGDALTQPISVPEAQLSPAQGGLGALLSTQRPGLVSSGVGAYTAPGTAGKSLTPGQKAVDEAFGKDYADSVTSGSIPDAEKGLVNLRAAIENLRTGVAPVGPVVGRLPDFVAQGAQDPNKGLVPTRNAIEDSVQRSLKAILGGTFTATEGTQVVKRAFDPTVGKEESIRRLELLANSIENGLNVRKDAIKHFTDTGSLTGWKGTLPTRASIEAAADAKAPSAGAAPSQGDLVPVLSPDGKPYKIPKANLEAALARGFKTR